MGVLQILVTVNSDQDAATKPATSLQNVEGIVGIYSGVQIEDPSCVHWVIHWKDLEAQKKFQASDSYKEFLEAAGPHTEAPVPVIVELQPDEDIQVTLRTPISEFAFAALKEESQRKEWEECLQVTLGGMKATEGAVAGVRGIAEGNSSLYVFVIGWSSIEAHKNALSAPYAQDIYNETLRLTKFVAKHAPMQNRYTK